MIDTRSVSTSSFYVGQGDIDNLTIILYNDSVAVSFIDEVVYFVMKNDVGTVRHVIPCTVGAVGEITVPLSDVETAIGGTYMWNIVVTSDGGGGDLFYGEDFFGDDFFGDYFGDPENAAGRFTYPSDTYGTLRIVEAL